MDNTLKVGDLVILRNTSWKGLGVITQIDMRKLGIDPAFVEVMWLGYRLRHLERASNLEVLNEKR